MTNRGAIASALVYLIAVAVIAGFVHSRSGGASVPALVEEVEVMTWSETKTESVPAKPVGTWTWVFDYVQGPALLKIEAEGKWRYSATKECGPDGDLNSLVQPGQAVSASAPIGALLVKIGGSTAGKDDGKVHVAGTRAVISIDANSSGPVFVTINDELTGFADNSGSLSVTLSVAQLPPPPPRPATGE